MLSANVTVTVGAAPALTPFYPRRKRGMGVMATSCQNSGPIVK